MPTPTPDQQAVLASTGRLRVVRAAPGSGKTWMVGEAIRGELKAWRPATGGIAALSFTRVGSDEIRQALGCDLPHPHFLGTIDAFLFRYVVRPHLRALVSSATSPELIPPDWRPGEFWTLAAFDNGKVNPYACVWTGRDATGRALLGQPNRYKGGFTPLSEEMDEKVRKFKGNLLRNHGRITLPDAMLYATEILKHRSVGPVVRGELARRFPLVVIDELQDTGEFLAESIHALLDDDGVRGLVVGDPDQAIYEFNGAAPGKFDTFASRPGAEVFELRASMRCPESAVRVAAHLRRSPTPLVPAADRAGRAFLVAYCDLERDVAAIAATIRRTEPTGVVKVVTRWNDTVEQLTGRPSDDVPVLRCRPATLLHRAVRYFRGGRTVTALAAAHTAVMLPILGGEGFTDQAMRDHGIDPAALRELAIQCLLAANALPTTGTAHTWETEAFAILTSHVADFCEKTGTPPLKTFRSPQKCKGHDAPVTASIPEAGVIMPDIAGVPVFTVHGVKGETHHVTVVVVPPVPEKKAEKRCPSVVWWQDGGADDEERRVAYVALTRTCRDVVLCLDQGTYSRLAERRPEFVTGFEFCTVDDFKACWPTAPTASS